MLKLDPEEGSRQSAENRKYRHRCDGGEVGILQGRPVMLDSRSKACAMKMELTLEQIPRDDPGILADIHRLALDAGFDTSMDRLESSWIENDQASIGYGAYARGKLVAANLFTAHDVLVSNVRHRAFQYGWGAVDPEYREQDLIRQIVERAKTDLARQGASFIFGFADAASASQFKNEAGFRSVDMRCPLFVSSAPRLLLGRQLGVREYFWQLSAGNVVRFDHYQTCRWKSQTHDDLISVEHYTNFIWGRNTQRMIPGLGRLSVFQAGGCEINKPQLFGDLLRKLHREHGVLLVQFECTADSMMARAAHISLADAQGRVFIYFPFGELPPEVRFDAHAGLRSIG